MPKSIGHTWLGHYTLAQSNRGGGFYVSLWFSRENSPQFPTPESAKEWAVRKGGLYLHDWTKA